MKHHRLFHFVCDGIHRRILAVASALALLSSCVLHAAGIIPERVNQIILKGSFPDPEPAFLLICSARPLKDSQGRLVMEMQEAELRRLASNEQQVVIKLHGKKPTGNRQDYLFGTAYDADMPWNNGVEFDAGCNKGMVWAHAPLGLPDPGEMAKMTPDQRKVFDEKVYFAVPAQTP